MAVTTYKTRLLLETCCVCGVPFGMSEALHAARRRDMDWFYCPNGHAQQYRETEADRLRKKLAAAKAEAEYYRDQYEGAERRRDDADADH